MTDLLALIKIYEEWMRKKYPGLALSEPYLRKVRGINSETTMTDLLTDLRFYCVRPGETVHESHPAYLMARAADEIERLRAVEQFACDASHLIVSAAAAPHSPLEHQALRASWLRALAALGLSEEQARERGRGLWQRAPKETDHADR